MRMLGNYFVFFISMMGMILADNDDKYQQFYEKLLELHNQHRLMHDAGPLLMKEELSVSAMKMAKDVDIGTDSEVDLNIGNNMYFEELNIEPNASVVFNSWYDEGHYYSHIDDAVMRFKTSAFTQIVWKSTTHIGMAVRPGKDHLIIVATYSPAGNDSDDYLTNVVTINDRKDDSSSSWGIKKQRTGF